ncbi:MAG: CPBP family intramembrane metalloprotease [candidate division Zixibacteria bacterium]|nr:CPBP family intramembrane metalloprotease [candidate division Zixibacteria bacterium]
MINFSISNRAPQSNIKTAFILLFAPVVLTVFRYYGSASFYSNHFASGNSFVPQYYYFLISFVLLGLIPVLISVFGFRMNLSALGLGLGGKRATIIFTLIGIPIMILLAYLSSRNPAFRTEYPLAKALIQNQSGFSLYLLMYGFYYIGWEIFFRGFMLLGLNDSLGDVNSILIQTIPSCLMHIGKPDTEIFASILAGLIFGWAVIKCRSIWPVFFSHWALGAFLDIFIIYG